MKIEGKEYRTIWFENNIVKIIDQTKLPHQFIIKDLKTIKDAIIAVIYDIAKGAKIFPSKPLNEKRGKNETKTSFIITAVGGISSSLALYHFFKSKPSLFMIFVKTISLTMIFMVTISLMIFMIRPTMTSLMKK